MKKQVLSLLLAGALTLGLFGCSAQTPEESGVPQSAPAQTEGTASAGVVEELKIGICKEVTPRTLASESGSFGRMNYNAFCAGTWLVRDENNEMQPNLMTSWEILDKGSTIRATFATDQGITWHDGEPFTIDDVIFTVEFDEQQTQVWLSLQDHRRGEGRRYHRGLPGGRWGGLFHPGELRRLCAYVSQAHLGRNRGSLRLHRRGCCHRLRPL